MLNNDIENFKYLDNLIHSGVKEIVLDSDIVLGSDEESQYLNGIKLDVDDLAIGRNGHAIDYRKMSYLFKIFKYLMYSVNFQIPVPSFSFLKPFSA